MNYDENVFKEKANRKARRIWFIFAILLSANYGSDVANGLNTASYYAVFLALCWIPIVSGEILLRVKGWETDLYKYNLVIGYGIFYTFVISTTESPIAFTYILPVTSLLVLYKNRKFMVYCGIVNSIIIIISSVYHVMCGYNSEADMKNYQLELSAIILCYICYVMSIHHLNESDGAMTNSIKADLKRVITTVEKVKTASNSIMSGVSVVREISVENTHSANVVVDGMVTLKDNNGRLEETTSSSVNMTTDINSQVQHVAEMIEQMVSLTVESGEHAKNSSDDLKSLVETTHLMTNLASEMGKILENFREEFERVKLETGKIEEITEQTTLLALNASIEAARAGEAGRGFGVVAQQISSLSTETQSSSGQIEDALIRLQQTSDKMTASMEETIKLVQETFKKVTKTGKNVGKINDDSKQLESHIQEIDTAMKEVENSNRQLVDNMDNVSGIVSDMTGCISYSNEISNRMLSKYEESMTNINDIEKVVEALMCELGIGGFMGIEDIQPGMKVQVSIKKADLEDSVEILHGDVIKQIDDKVIVNLPKAKETYKESECQLQITVGNVLYMWKSAGIKQIQSEGAHTFEITVTSRPTIKNRRKYPRMDINNKCKIILQESGKVIDARLDNISANGFALLTKDSYFKENKNAKIKIEIEDFDLPKHNVLEGRVIRCSENDGMYIVGCQMPEDDNAIREYVNNSI
ncbi:methyl-accepting chemotaxis protein [Eubacterium sp. MSJ-13]|uniref:methyl-accepting chemotaxis protein n=1 Tax=Eubacterium sp. MSJ-13 TaxID=2841513 RepID=UPI001C0F87F2|nr:methyl-accepting chemotaxis protein [Eubacterium sp. MSJ-13]MBU5477960.1 methyl-accepting chemotaxis protein [Eubacterium sp. MSJ-13]